jgi:CRP-like cAMP-binding protein
MTHEGKVVPKVFTDQEEVVFTDGDIVFTQGEKSSYLYYIVSGEFEIIANGKRVSILTPEDIFLGEMSFLLDNRRSATVKSMGRGVLIKISKEAFINSIKERPHYGIFLARLLAQRLVKLHKVTTA